MTVKNKIIRVISVMLLAFTVLTFSFGDVLLLSYYGILPTDHSTGIFDVSLVAAAYCSGIGTFTGALGLWLHRISGNKNGQTNTGRRPNLNLKSINIKKAAGIILMSISAVALTYSLYLILYYFDIIPNHNLGFIDISHLVAGIVAVPAAILGTAGFLLYRSGNKKK